MSASPPDSNPKPATSRSGLRVFRWLVGAALICCVAHVFTNLTWFGRRIVGRDVMVWVDVRNDLGPLTLVSVLAMMLVGIAALRLARVRDRSEHRGWILVGVLFIYLAVDDALTIHELIGVWAYEFLGNDLVHPWLVVLLPLLAILGFLTFHFLLKTLWHDRPRLSEMVAGYGCLGAALAIEVAERWLTDSSFRLRGFPIVEYSVVPEEFLEALGPALLLLCFTRIRTFTLAAQQTQESVPR